MAIFLFLLVLEMVLMFKRLWSKWDGGGHFNNAATQIYEKYIDEVQEDLIEILKKEKTKRKLYS